MERVTTEGRPEGVAGREARGERWAFPTVVRCPADEGGCGSLHTKSDGTHGACQYRVCRDCGWRWKVVGESV